MTTSMEGERDFGSAATTTRRTGSGDLWIVVLSAPRRMKRILYGGLSLGERMATRVLYMEERRGQEPDPCYAREFDASVIDRGPDFVILDQTLFYAEGGGQPYDTGVLRGGEAESKVLRVMKDKGVIKHYVDRMPMGTAVHGIVDWGRRYKHMRMHTSQHLMSGLVFRIYGARTVGNQIHTDYSRVDFQPANFTPEDLKRIEDETNSVIESKQEVRIFEEDRVVVHNKIEDRALLDLIPESVRRLRVIQIGSADYCPCGGTHLKNVSEIGRVRVTEKRSKGRETDRIVYELVPP
ncbi:MAG: alanyl-tRNA editing protein [Methanobacteriota archaeon]|nr:MAG: alanyl-tRNA editing protein [Euryarchaeota archaeon]